MTVAIRERLSEKEARSLTDDIKRGATLLGERLLLAYEGEAWAALGYPSWREYAVEEFGIEQSRAYRLLAQTRVIAALDQVAVSPIGEKPIINEAQARELSPIKDDPAALAAVWSQANEVSDGNPTAAVIRGVREQLYPPAHEATNGKVTAAAIREVIRPTSELESDGRLESFTSRVSADGRERPASQPPRPIVDPAPAEPAGASFPDVPDESPDTDWADNGPDLWDDEPALTQEQCEALDDAVRDEIAEAAAENEATPSDALLQPPRHRRRPRRPPHRHVGQAAPAHPPGGPENEHPRLPGPVRQRVERVAGRQDPDQIPAPEGRVVVAGELP